jgi:small conductance mechanosensitive channel
LATPAPPLPPILPTTIPTDPTLPPFVNDARRLLLGDGELMRHMADAAGGLAVNLAVALAIFLGTMWAANWASQLTASGIARAHRRRPPDATLQTFAASLVRYLVIIIGVIAMLQQLGVKATSVIAVLGAASLAVGLALQGALANVAAGVMLLILRPYRVGDAVEVAGRQGTVRGLDLFTTRLASGDNLSVHVPNAKAFGDIIVNQSTPVARQVALDFVIDYEDDVDRALAILLDCAAAEPSVSDKPEPWARLTAMGERGITLTLRAWFTPKAFDSGRYDLLKRVKDALEAQGFTFPYPQQVAIEARKFEPPHSRRRGKAAAPRPKPKVSPRSDAPRSTRAGSSKGR